MKKQSHNKVVFKPYVMGQPSLLPADLGELIPKDHVVRTIDAAIEQIDLSILYAQQLSSPDDAESTGVRGCGEVVFFAADR